MSALSVITSFASITGALIAAFSYTTGKQLKTTLEDGLIKIIDEKGVLVAAIPEFREKSLRGSKMFLQRIPNITATKKPDSPNFKFQWKDKDVKLISLSLIPDGDGTPTKFRAKGIIEILINKVPVFPANTAAAFTDISAFSVPLPDEGITLKRGEWIEVFCWTSDGTASAITVSGLVGDYE